jgi:hypothetical protein
MLDTMPSITRVQKRQQALPGPLRLTIEGSLGAWPGDNSNQCTQGYGCPVSPVISFKKHAKYYMIATDRYSFNPILIPVYPIL